MITNLGLIIILGLLANEVFAKIKLPGILGMLLAGVLVGPHGFGWIGAEVMGMSADLRRLALIIILLRAGFGVNRDELRRVGAPALKMSFIPSLLEGFAVAAVSVWLLGFSFVEGCMLGFILAAVSPAVVVPQMLRFSSEGLGTKKGIPALLLAGSAADNIFAITVFAAFVRIYQSGDGLAYQLVNIPLSIAAGLALGVAAGIAMIKFFERFSMRDTKKVLVILAMAILVSGVETLIKSKIAIAGFLSVMTVGFMILDKKPDIAGRIASKLDKIWVFAEILLFVLLGAMMDIKIAASSGVAGIIIISAGIAARSLGVLVSVAGTNLNARERLFCVIAYSPKATVQAAMGAVPLAIGVPSGGVILAVAALSVVITAPLGAAGIRIFSSRLLHKDRSA